MRSIRVVLCFGVFILLCSVKADTKMPYFTVNGEEVSTNASSQQEGELNRYYSFYDGEPVKIACQNHPQEYFELKLSYTSKANEILSTYIQKYLAVEMYIKLSVLNDDTHIDCKITNSSNISAITVRTLNFKLKEKPPILGFQVNGLTLTPELRPKKDYQTLSYNYEYYNGELLQIASLKDEQKYGLMHCYSIAYGKDIPNELQVFKPELSWSNSSVHISTVLNINKILYIKCEVEIKRTYGFGKKKHVTVSLALVPNRSFFDESFNVTGLSLANILLRYKSGQKSYVIMYKYDDTKELHLNCYSKFKKVNWFYSTPEVEEKANSFPKKYTYNRTSFNMIKGVFKLNAEQKSSTITCRRETSNDSIYVKLIRVKSNQNESHVNKKIVVGASVVVVIVAVIVIVWTTVSLCKQKKSTPKLDRNNTNCESLQERRQREMPAPIQLSEYATPVDTNNTDTYSVPYVPETIYEMYAKPIPKHLRQKETEPTYAEINLSNESEDVKNTSIEEQDFKKAEHILKKPRNDYAQSLYPKINHSPSTNDSLKNKIPDAKSKSDKHIYENSNIPINKYETISYVKASSDVDCVEPAYCEVNFNT